MNEVSFSKLLTSTMDSLAIDACSLDIMSALALKAMPDSEAAQTMASLAEHIRIELALVDKFMQEEVDVK